MPATCLGELDREELRRRTAAGGIVLLPLGAFEQHGPHLPLGTDSLVVEYLAVTAAAAAKSDVLVAPVLAFGSSDHHMETGGAISFGTEPYLAALKAALSGLLRCGARRLFLLNGHGGNEELAALAARDTALAAGGAIIAAASYWRIAAEPLAALDLPGPVPGHAGAFETSLVLAVRPDLVRQPLPARDPVPPPLQPAGHRVERSGAWAEIGGFTDSPGCASPEAGRTALDAAAAAIASALDDLAGRARGASAGDLS